MRNTKQRTAVLEFLRSKRQHCSATQVYDAVRVKFPNISLGTVYRNLSQLLEDGKIISVETSDKCVYYDGFTSDHAHFVCERCKEIYDFPLVSSISGPEEAGFTVLNQRVVYYGVCSKCNKNNA
ncbi:MAG: transcriptional repressor [Clostridia bacterium]|nr:transcriptional repressor [Clostridia bacterium]